MKKFFILWISQAASLLGSSLVQFALAWYLTKETGSATVLATAVMAGMIPQIILGPIIGPYIDRWDRKKIMIIADSAIALVTALLVMIFLFDAIQIWHIYAAVILRSVGNTFHFPAISASIPQIVPEKQLARTAGLMQMLGGIVNIIAPPAGALLMETMPMYGVLAVDIVTAAIAVVCVLFIAIPKPVRTTLTEHSSAVGDMLQGLRYIWSWRGLSILLGLITIAHFFTTPAFVLLPVFVTENLESDVLKLGWLSSAFGVGIVAGGLILGVWGGFKRRIVTSMTGIFIAGIATIGLGFTTINLFALGIVSCFTIGFGVSFADAPFLAILQSAIDKDMQGRVFALIGSINAAVSPLGLAVAGPVADAIGTRYLMFIAGTAFLLVGIISFLIPSVLNIEKQGGTQLPDG